MIRVIVVQLINNLNLEIIMCLIRVKNKNLNNVFLVFQVSSLRQNTSHTSLKLTQNITLRCYHCTA